MPRPWSQRLLTLLQLTRMALVFTAIADGWCGLLLWERHLAGPNAPLGQLLNGWRLLGMAMASVGLYGFGMSLNDIIDRRRDRQISPGRPLPSGRVSLVGAHLVCGALAALGLGGGMLVVAAGGPSLAVALVAGTLALIAFYDLAGKYLVGLGLVTLGLVRFVHAMIPAFDPGPAGSHDVWHPFVWHPLWLLNHVAILSAVCYAWEQKRPQLNVRHWTAVLLTVLAVDAGTLYVIGTTGPGEPSWESFVRNVRLDWLLLIPLAKSLVFVLIAWRVKRKAPTSREAGQATMLYGLLWLIVYDACFACIWVHWAAGLALLILLPMAYGSVRVMRGWSKLVAASQRPEFKRAGT